MRGSLKSAHYTCPDLPLFYRCQINIKYANVKRFTPLGMPGMRMQGRFIGTIRFPFAEEVEGVAWSANHAAHQNCRISLRI
jgi:hypothetical protein